MQAVVWYGMPESNQRPGRYPAMLPLHVIPHAPGLSRRQASFSALPHSCRMMLRPRFVVECAGAGRPLCPGPGADGRIRTRTQGATLGSHQLAYVCIWAPACLAECRCCSIVRADAEGVLVAAPGVANGPRTRNPRLGRPMLCLIELLPHESSHQGANWCSVACSIFLHVSSRIYRSSSGMSIPLRTSSFRCPAR